MPGGQRLRIRRIDHEARRIQHSENPRQPRQALLQGGIERAQRPHRARGNEQGGDKAGKLAHRAQPIGHPPADKTQHGGHRQPAQHLQHGINPGAAGGNMEQGFAQPQKGRAGTGLLGGFQPIGAHHAGG